MSPTLLRILMQRRRDIEADPSAYLKRKPITEARKEAIVFVDLDQRQYDGYTVSLEWDRATGKTQIVVGDIRNARANSRSPSQRPTPATHSAIHSGTPHEHQGSAWSAVGQHWGQRARHRRRVGPRLLAYHLDPSMEYLGAKRNSATELPTAVRRRVHSGALHDAFHHFPRQRTRSWRRQGCSRRAAGW